MVAYQPVALVDETLSSWLLRLIARHGSTPHTFCDVLWPGNRFWTSDLDRTISDGWLQEIGRVTGVSTERLNAMTLREMVELSGFPSRIQGAQSGILPIGIFHRLRGSHGQQYCPACLSAATPYLQRAWRSEFAVVCLRHGIGLRDGCPRCGEPFIPHRGRALATRRCHCCQASLMEGEPAAASAGAFALQRVVTRALGIPLPEGALLVASDLSGAVNAAGCELLAGVRDLCRVVASSLRRRQQLPKGVEWGLLRTGQRSKVLERVSSLLSNWPGAWIQWSKDELLTQHGLKYEHGPWSAWTGAQLAHLPFSRGPLHRWRGRKSALTIRQLRRRTRSIGEYRQARIDLLLQTARPRGTHECL